MPTEKGVPPLAIRFIENRCQAFSLDTEMFLYRTRLKVGIFTEKFRRFSQIAEKRLTIYIYIYIYNGLWIFRKKTKGKKDNEKIFIGGCLRGACFKHDRVRRE
ncbi:MAG: hypothetical protein NC299_07555 [Lachnospiraceae bacterium]|nr:hypothetical protein [Lachnospiraceae bacterium]